MVIMLLFRVRSKVRSDVKGSGQDSTRINVRLREMFRCALAITFIFIMYSREKERIGITNKISVMISATVITTKQTQSGTREA